METQELKSGYAADRAKPARAFRTISHIEAATLRGMTVGFIDRFGQVRNAKVTSVKTWKTRADVEVRLQYGLYEHFTTLYTASAIYGTTLVLPL